MSHDSLVELDINTTWLCNTLLCVYYFIHHFIILYTKWWSDVWNNKHITTCYTTKLCWCLIQPMNRVTSQIFNPVTKVNSFSINRVTSQIYNQSTQHNQVVYHVSDSRIQSPKQTAYSSIVWHLNTTKLCNNCSFDQSSHQR